MNSAQRIVSIAALGLALGPALALASPAADDGFRGWGPQLGLSLGPDQIHFGAHLDFGQFKSHIRFQPNVEFGFRDNLRLTTFNLEAAYRFSQRWDLWSPYVGGGAGANVKSGGAASNSGSRTDIGLNAIIGLERGLSSGDRFFIETKTSLNDVPDAKVTVGWTFYH